MKTITVRDYFTYTTNGQKVIHLLADRVKELGRLSCETCAWAYLRLTRALSSVDEYFNLGSDSGFYDSDSWANTPLDRTILDAEPEEVLDQILLWEAEDEDAHDIFSTDDDAVLQARRSMLGKFVADRYAP
jgi:hypothetical protein